MSLDYRPMLLSHQVFRETVPLGYFINFPPGECPFKLAADLVPKVCLVDDQLITSSIAKILKIFLEQIYHKLKSRFCKA
jgi:hypothetical protein